MTKRIIAGALVLIAAFAYFRPLSIYTAAREAYLLGVSADHAYTRVGPHRIHYYVLGEGPPVVLVHGVATRAADALPIFTSLAKHHRVYALDLLGYGDSDKPTNAEYSVATQSEIVRGFMDAMHLRDADVIGVSMGGWIALKFAADHPERVRRLVLVSSAGLEFPTILTERSFSSETIQELRANFKLQSERAGKMPDFILRDFLRRGKNNGWVNRRMMQSMLTRRDLLDHRLQRVRMPVLLVWGTADRIVPFFVAGKMQREMPQAQLVTLPGCSHLAIIECRGEALPAIERFLARR